MQHLQQAVGDDGGDIKAARGDARVFLIDEVVQASRLQQRGAVYRNEQCRENQTILTERQDVALALKESIANVEVITAPNGEVGVEVFKPRQPCRQVIQRRLRTLAASGSP